MSAIGDFFRWMFGQADPVPPAVENQPIEMTGVGRGMWAGKTVTVNADEEVRRNRQVKRDHVFNYVADCLVLAREVFGMGGDELAEFNDWAYRHHMANIDDPYNIHDHPFTTVAAFEGILLATDKRYEFYHKKMLALLVKPSIHLWYNSYHYFGSRSSVSA
jgi:hypothetical protein